LVFYLEYSWFGKQVNFAKIILLEENLTGLTGETETLAQEETE
jgi:hypothetical protein